MNSSSQFMDKQIMGLSGSPNGDFFELLNPQEEQNGAEKKEEILPSYDFQPIRPQGSARAWNSAELKSNAASSRNYGALDPPNELAKVTSEKDRGLTDMDMVTQIDRTMKKYADNLLHTLEGVSARLSQLETRTHHLESSVGDLKVTVGNNHGNTDGRLRQLENILREVQTGVQVLRDKQEIAEAQLQLLKLQVSKAVDQPTETPNTTQMDSLQQTISQQQQSGQPHSQPPVALLQPSHPTLPPPNAPPPPLLQNPSPPLQIPNQLPQNQMPTTTYLPRDSFYPPSSQPLDPTLSPYQLPGQQPQPVPQQPYQAPPQLPQYPQPSQLPQQQQAPGPVNPSIPPPMSHHPEENSYMSPASQTYPPNVRPPSSLSQLPSGPPPSQQFYGPNPHMYEPSGNRPGSGQLSFPGSYGSSPPGPTFNDPYPYPGPSSHYGSSSMKQPPHSSPSAPSGGSGYSRLPTAQLLPQALPTASNVSSGSGSGGTGNRVPIDDVVDKVTTMGFSRDQVRATVRKLTENGQSVDLNVVLDKLMNDGEIQPQKGWFGR